VADELTPEVINALVRLMSGEIDVESLSKEERYALAEQLMPDKARALLYRTLSSLNDDGETFEQIGKRLRIHMATASRLAKPPSQDRRRRRDSTDPADPAEPAK